MPVTGTESLAELRTACNEKTQKSDEMWSLYVKGELPPDQISEMKDLQDEVKSYLSAIENFPTVDNFREDIDGAKKFLRARATPPPPSAGQTTGGDGRAVKSLGEHKGAGNGPPQGYHAIHVKSLGDMLVDEIESRKSQSHGRGFSPSEGKGEWTAAFKGFDRLHGYTYDDGLGNFQPYKATLDLTAAPLTNYDRRPGIVTLEQQRLTIADLLTTINVTGPTHRYVRETTYTNAATTVAMAGTKPEASWALEEIDVAIRKIAVTAKVPDEMFEDYQALRSYVDERLRFMVLQEEEDQLLNGSGSSPNMRGILQVSGIQTETSASAADDIDAIHRGLTKVQAVGFFEPDGIIIHPNDYQLLRLTRDNNEQYYGGGPFTGAYGNNGIPANPGVWAQRTVKTTAIAEGTVLVGSFRMGAALLRRSGVNVQMTNTDQDDFVKNLMTIRVEERAALACYRPLAFCAVTLS